MSDFESSIIPETFQTKYLQ